MLKAFAIRLIVICYKINLLNKLHLSSSIISTVSFYGLYIMEIYTFLFKSSIAKLTVKKKKKSLFLFAFKGCFCSSLVVHQDKDLSLSLQQLGLLLWCRLNPWPRNFCMPQAWPKTKTKSIFFICHEPGTPRMEIGWGSSL